MEYLYHLLRTWRDLIYPSRQMVMLRFFAWYKAGARLIQILPRTFATVIYGCAALAILYNVYVPLFSALAVVTSVWFVRPSTMPKSSHLLLEQSARFGAVIPLAFLAGIGGTLFSLWILTTAAFFLFEVPFNKSILCIFRFCLIMIVSLLPVGVVCALIDYGAYMIPVTYSAYLSASFCILPLIIACIIVPLVVESFHTHRAWYDPL